MADDNKDDTLFKLPRNNTGSAIGGMLMFILIAAVGALNQQIGSGQVPIPDAWKWVVPIVTATLAAIVAVATPYISTRTSGR